MSNKFAFMVFITDTAPLLNSILPCYGNSVPRNANEELE